MLLQKISIVPHLIFNYANKKKLYYVGAGYLIQIDTIQIANLEFLKSNVYLSSLKHYIKV